MRKSFVLVCAFAIIFWSITFVNTRSLLSDFSALALIFICFGLALEFLGTGPKNLRVFAIFGLWSGFAAVAALKRRGGCVRASASRPEAVSIALRDHRLSETTNFEKVGPTFSICSEL